MEQNIKFKTIEEIKEYLGQPKIQCLICGNWYSHLTYSHLKKHGTDSNSYREEFGLPKTVGLCGVEHSKKLSKRMNDLIAAEIITHEHNTLEFRKKIRIGKGGKFQPWRKKITKFHLDKARIKAVEKAKSLTHCKNGHPLILRTDGKKRYCRECAIERSRLWHLNNKKP